MMPEADLEILSDLLSGNIPINELPTGIRLAPEPQTTGSPEPQPSPAASFSAHSPSTIIADDRAAAGAPAASYALTQPVGKMLLSMGALKGGFGFPFGQELPGSIHLFTVSTWNGVYTSTVSPGSSCKGPSIYTHEYNPRAQYGWL